MSYSYDNKGKKYFKDSGSWKQLSMWSSADNVEFDGSGVSFLPAAFGSAATAHAFMMEIDNYFGQANGFASLGSDGKVPAGQLPAAVTGGGMNFIGGVSANTDIETLMIAQIGATPEVADAGKFMIITTGGTLTNSSGNSAHHVLQSSGGDQGDDTFPLTLEAEDWLVLLDVDDGTPLYTWGVISNDWQQASTAIYGVTRLSDATTFASLSGDDVITEGTLSTVLTDGVLLKTTASWNSSAGFMKSDGDGTFSVDANTYLTSYNAKAETLTGYSEAGSFAEVTSSDTILSAIEQLAYTAKTAYNWGDHALEGYWVEGDAAHLNESGTSANSDSKILTFNYRDGSATARTLTIWAEGDDGQLWSGGSNRNSMPFAGTLVSASAPTTEGNDGDFYILTS